MSFIERPVPEYCDAKSDLLVVGTEKRLYRTHVQLQRALRHHCCR